MRTLASGVPDKVKRCHHISDSMQWAGAPRLGVNQPALRRPADRAPVTGHCRLAGLLNHRRSSRGLSAREAYKHAGTGGGAAITRAMAGYFIRSLPRQAALALWLRRVLTNKRLKAAWNIDYLRKCYLDYDLWCNRPALFLTVAKDGAVPLYFQVASGNVADNQTHHAT